MFGTRPKERIMRELDKKFDNKYNEGYNQILLADAESKARSKAVTEGEAYQILHSDPYGIRYVSSWNKGYMKNQLSYTDQETILEQYVRNLVEKSTGKKKYFMDEEDMILYEDTLNDLISKQNKLNEINNYIKRIKEDTYEEEKELKTQKLIEYFNGIAKYLSDIGIILCFLRFKKTDKDIDYGVKRKRKRKSTKRKSTKRKIKNRCKSIKHKSKHKSIKHKSRRKNSNRFYNL
jgi:hypothetical protein